MNAASLKLVHYPHPALRWPAKPLEAIDKNVVLVAGRMLEIMYEHHGLGLAAPQVAWPFQMTVMNPSGDPQQMHFDLTGLASDRPLRTGSTSCEALRHLDAMGSLPMEVIVDQPRLLTDAGRVAHMAITKVGPHTLAPDVEPKVPLAVRPGVPVEVAQFERVGSQRASKQ